MFLMCFCIELGVRIYNMLWSFFKYFLNLLNVLKDVKLM
jgi:hypothetical protein